MGLRMSPPAVELRSGLRDSLGHRWLSLAEGTRATSTGSPSFTPSGGSWQAGYKGSVPPPAACPPPSKFCRLLSRGGGAAGRGFPEEDPENSCPRTTCWGHCTAEPCFSSEASCRTLFQGLGHRRRGVAGLGSRHRPGLRGGPAQGGQESTGQGASTPDLRGWSMSIPWGLGQVPPRPQDFLSGGARPRPAGGAPQP